MLSSFNPLVLKKLCKRSNVNIIRHKTIKQNKGHLSHSQLRYFESKSYVSVNKTPNIYINQHGKRYYSNNHKPIMEKGEEAPCRVPIKKTNQLKFLDLLFYKKFMNKLDSRWDKSEYLGIEKLYKDFRSPEVKDEDNIYNPYPKRSWWHRPYYYRSFDAFMDHKNNMKRLKKYAADAFVFKGTENKRGQFIHRLRETLDLIRKNIFSISHVRLSQVVRYLQYLKMGNHGFDVHESEPILSMEEEIQKQAGKYRVAWREDWKNFWREYPPLEPWQAPRSVSDPDPHIPLDSNTSIIFNDIIWKGSGQEDFIHMLDRLKKSKNPLNVLKYSVGSYYLSDRYREKLIKIREEERHDRFQLGSIHRGAMDVILEYMPGWNHATHSYDYGRRLSMKRTFREEEEIMARYPDPLSPQDRNESVPPYMEMLFQWRSYPDPIFSKFAYIDPITHAYQLQAHSIGDEKGATELLPDILKRRTSTTQYPRHWLYIFSTREGLNHEIGDMPNVDEQYSNVNEMMKDPNLLDYISKEPMFEELFSTDERRVPLTRHEIKESIKERREKIPEWKIKLLTNRSFISLYQSFKQLFRINSRKDAYDRFKLIFFKHLPELLSGRKKIPEDIKQDVNEYKDSWKSYVKENLKLDEDKLKYIAEQRKKKNNTTLNKQDKREYHTSRIMKFLTEEEKNFLKDALSNLKNPNIYNEAEVPKYKPDQDISEKPSEKISDYLDLNNFPKISIRKPNVKNPIPFPKFPKIPVSHIHDDPFEIEMNFVAKQRIKQIRNVLGELFREKLLRRSHTARKIERRRRFFIDSVLKFYEKLTKDQTYTDDYVRPVSNLAEEYIDSLTGLKFHQPKSLLESLLADNAIKIALMPSQKELHEEYEFYKQKIDVEVNKKLKGKKVDEVEYFIEYVYPFFEEAEKDPSEKKKRFLLLRLDEYSRLFSKHPKYKSDREKYWDSLYEDYKAYAFRKDVKNKKAIDPSFNEEPIEQPRLRSLDEVLEEHGIFLNPVMSRLFPLRRNRWFPNIYYGPNGEPFDISSEHDIFRLKILSDSFLSVNKVINYGKSQFWIKQIRKLQGSNFDGELLLEEDPKKLVKIFVKTLLQMSFDKDRYEATLDNENLEKKIEEIEEKKNILKKYGTYLSLIAELRRNSGIKDILHNKLPTHSGDLYFEDGVTKKELYTLLFLRACLDKSIHKYHFKVRNINHSIDDIDEDLYQWLVDHYKTEPQTLIIQKAPPTYRRHKPIPPESSLILHSGVDSSKITNFHTEKITELLSRLESLDPVQWISVVRDLHDDKELTKLLGDSLEVAEKYGLPTSEKYMKTAMKLISKVANSPVENIREDYNLFITSMNDYLVNLLSGNAEDIEEGEDNIDEIFLSSRLHSYEEGPKDHALRYLEDNDLKTLRYAKYDVKILDKELDIDKDSDTFDISIEEFGEEEEKGEAESVDQVEEKSEEPIKVEEEEKVEDKTIDLTEEERQLLDEIFDDEKLDYVLAELRDERIMSEAGIIPFNEDLTYTWDGYPYDVRDVNFVDKATALTMEEKNDPVFQKVLALNDPSLIKTTRLLKHIESGSTKYGEPLLVLSEIAYQIKRSTAGLEPTLPPRIKSIDPATLEFEMFNSNGGINRQRINEISETRKKDMGYDPVKFVFDVGSAIEGEDIFAHRNPIDNSAIDLTKPVNEIPFATIEPPSLLESVEFEIELRKALSENVSEDIKELIDEQYAKLVEKIKHEPLEVKETVSPIEEILLEEEEEEIKPEERITKEEEETLDILDIGYESLRGDVQEEQVIKQEEPTEVHLEGLVVAKEKEEEFGLAIGEMETGLASTKERVEKFVKRGLFKSLGFGGKEKAKQETDFLKLMKVVIPGFNYKLWLRGLEGNFSFIVDQLKRGNLNYIRLVASEQVVLSWTTADYLTNLTGGKRILITSVYVQKDIPYCDIMLRLELNTVEEFIDIKIKLKIDYKNQLYFYLENWKEKKEKPQKLRMRFGKRRYSNW